MTWARCWAAARVAEVGNAGRACVDMAVHQGIIDDDAPSLPDLFLKALICLFVAVASGLLVLFWLPILPLYL